MAMPQISSTHPGDLTLLIYDYVSAGDTLPMHNHDVATEHIIIAAKGRVMVRVQMPDGTVQEIELVAGDVVDTFAGFPHEVVAIEPGSKTIHIQKNIVPKSCQGT